MKHLDMTRSANLVNARIDYGDWERNQSKRRLIDPMPATRNQQAFAIALEIVAALHLGRNERRLKYGTEGLRLLALRLAQLFAEDGQ